MKNRDVKVLIVVILSVLLIVQLGVFLFLANSANKISEYSIAFVIVILAVSTSVYTILTRNKIRKSLNGDYLDLYDEVTSKIALSSLSIVDKKDAERAVMELLVEAKFNNKLPEEAIPDTDEFTKEMLEAYGGSKALFVWMLRGLMYWIIYIVFMQGYLYIKYGFNGETMPVFVILVYGIISLIGLPSLWYAMSNRDKRVYFLIPVLVLAGSMATFFNAHIWFEGTILYEESTFLNNPIVILALLFLAVLLAVIVRKIKWQKVL